MGDKHRCDISKPVNNPLLSGAGQGFPFDTFQGSSLLVPVSQDNSSVLSDPPGEADRFVGQDAPTEEQKSAQSESMTGQGYMRYLTSFFGNRQESDDYGRQQEPPRSSPYVPVPGFQTMTPSLQVPSDSCQSYQTSANVDKSPEAQPKTEVSPPYPYQQFQRPPPTITGPDFASKPPIASNAPPMFTGDSSKSYRLCHNKRPVYAPIPGLSLTTTASLVQDVHSGPSTYSAPPVRFPPPSGFTPTFPPAMDSVTKPTAFFASPALSGGDSKRTEPSPSISQSLFAPISKASTNPSEGSGMVFNPVAVHPPQQEKIPAVPLQQEKLPVTSLQQESTPVVETQKKMNVPQLENMMPQRDAIHPQPQTTPIVPTLQEARPIASIQQETIQIVPPSLTQLAHVGRTGTIYRPPYHHWFYRRDIDLKEVWHPFSMTDSVALEQAYQQNDEGVIPTDGGRYDVSVSQRTRNSVYWEETQKEVRRCSWFSKAPNESRYRPYDEVISLQLEEEYKKCVTTNSWKSRVDLPNNEFIVMHSPTNISHFDESFPMPDEWEGHQDMSQSLPTQTRLVKRGVLDFDIDDGEAPKVDHLILVVHGIGSVCDFRFRGVCDFKFRTIEEAVDISRTITNQLIKAHFSNSVRDGLVNRVEILPVSWHSHLHGETTGLDRKLETITLKSIPRLRNFTNDTLLDILFYTSPVYCQKIVQEVGMQIETIYAKFKMRNPNFNGSVSLVGHSLGSLILFDMLSNQKPPSSMPEPMTELQEKLSEAKLTSSFVVGNAGTGQPSIIYPQLSFRPVAFFALGSPIGMFVTVRGIDSLGLDFVLPTCPRFLNIFHPFDPVAYRIEALINPEMADKQPFLLPHHKGRKRMHLELREQLTRVGADLKQRLVASFRSTWNTVYQLTALGRADDGLEEELDKVIKRQIERSESEASALLQEESVACDLGKLNMGRRIDYVLQEAPLESFNEYVFAIKSHLVYWNSEDTLLMILKEVYGAAGIAIDGDTSLVLRATSSHSPPSPPSPSFPSVGWNFSGSANPTPNPSQGVQPYGFKST